LCEQPSELLTRLSIVPGAVPVERTFDSFAAVMAFVTKEPSGAS
jgi:hypothetical protein